MIIDTKDLEIAAVGISMAAGCRPCTAYHVKAAREAGASDTEIAEGLNVGIAVANTALCDLRAEFDEEIVASDDELITDELSRHGLLCAIGASVARNSVSQLRSTVAAAKQRGMSDNEVMEIIDLANRIKEKAASHLTPLIGNLDADPAIATAVASLCS